MSAAPWRRLERSTERTPRRPPTPAKLAVLGGLGLLLLAVVAAILWSWHRRHDTLPLVVVAATVVELALAALFVVVARSRRAAVALERGLVVGGFLVLFFLLPHGLFGDDEFRYADITQLLQHGTLSKSQYSLIMPLASVPVLALGNLVESRSWWAAHFNVIVVLIGVVAAFRLLRGRVDPQLLRRITLVLLSASFLTNRLRDYNAEVFTATLVAVGSLCLATGRYRLAGWVAIVIGAANTPAAIAGVAVIAATELIRSRRLRHLTPVLATAVLIMTEAWIRRGGPLTTGYSGNRGLRTIMPYSGLPGFSYPFLLGVAAILFSFGRGLLFYMPGLTLELGERTRRLVPERRWLTLLLAFTAALVLVYAKWWAWYGGIGWGPRFFVIAAVPASVLLAVRIHHAGESRAADALSLGLLLLSAWVGCAGAIADLGAITGFCGANNFQHEHLCWFTPDYSSLWLSVRQFPDLSAATTVTAVYIGVAFAYLASPLLAGLVRPWQPARSLLSGWRF